MFSFFVTILTAGLAFGQSNLDLGPEGGIVAPNYIISANPNPTNVTLSINTLDVSKRNVTAPALYGIMHEDISHSGDGGIYAELLINRAFQGTEINANDNPVQPYQATLTGWSTIGDNITLALDRLHPLSSALPNALLVNVGLNASGTIGIRNTGWWGMDVSPGTYNASFYVQALNSTYLNSTTTFTVSLRSNTTGEVMATSVIGNENAPIDTFTYEQRNVSFYCNVSAPDGNNTFDITFDGEQARGQTLYFSLFSLFPETFKGRPNGLRKDLAQALYDIKPKFLRCPGGNNIEGQSIATRLKWWETLGPLENRAGRVGDWGYYNTNGLGLMEYLYWCEDMEIEPLLAVYAGYSLDGTSYPLDHMDEVLQEILGELEFCLGDTSTKWGSYRAELGHPKPFKIRYVEVGNEDWFSSTYPYRFEHLYPALKQAYPDITFISTAYNENANGTNNPNANYTIDLPPNAGWDYHVYSTPSHYLDTFDAWDNWAESNNYTDQNLTILLGEYSVFQLDTSTGYVNYSDPAVVHPLYPQMIHALGEGVYQLSAERVPSLVQLSAYAPSLQNRNSYAWTPNLVSFTAKHNETILSTSYWQQWLFSNFRGDCNVPVINTVGDINPLFWIGNIDNESGSVLLKVINTGNQTVPLTIELDDSSYQSVNGTTLQSDDPNAFNTVERPETVKPRALADTELPVLSGTGFTWTVPIFSSTVIQFDK